MVQPLSSPRNPAFPDSDDDATEVAAIFGPRGKPLESIPPNVRGKRRTREHVLADLGVNHVERQALLCGFSVDRVQHDYGYDLTLATYTEGGEFEPGAVHIQVKATDRLPRLAKGKVFSWKISRRDLKLWLDETYPVILVVYDGENDVAYWIHVQEHVLRHEMPRLFGAGETINVRIRTTDRLTPQAIHRIARVKNEIHQRFRAGGRVNV